MSTDRLEALGGSVDLVTAEQLFSAARAIGGSLRFRAILADASTEPEQKKGAITAVFGRSLGPTALEVLATAASQRWSSDDDLLAGIEELAIRAAATSAGHEVDIESELFSFQAAVASSASLELAVGSKLGDAAAKIDLVDRLLKSKVSAQTLAIVQHLVQQPRGRRIGTVLRYAASVVADQAGQSVAVVTSARPIGDAQLERLRAGLSRSYGKQLRVNAILDPALIGGVRVQVGDDIIDGSVAARLGELKLQLVG